ncbi:MAG TPA: hypothetical protein VIY73_20735 [Polyangiaceae bacterium]
MSRARTFALLTSGFALAGTGAHCGARTGFFDSGAAPATDAGSREASPPDAATLDASGLDADAIDAGLPDRMVPASGAILFGGIGTADDDEYVYDDTWLRRHMSEGVAAAVRRSHGGRATCA